MVFCTQQASCIFVSVYLAAFAPSNTHALKMRLEPVELGHTVKTPKAESIDVALDPESIRFTLEEQTNPSSMTVQDGISNTPSIHVLGKARSIASPIERHLAHTGPRRSKSQEPVTSKISGLGAVGKLEGAETVLDSRLISQRGDKSMNAATISAVDIPAMGDVLGIAPSRAGFRSHQVGAPQADLEVGLPSDCEGECYICFEDKLFDGANVCQHFRKMCRPCQEHHQNSHVGRAPCPMRCTNPDGTKVSIPATALPEFLSDSGLFWQAQDPHSSLQPSAGSLFINCMAIAVMLVVLFAMLSLIAVVVLLVVGQDVPCP